MNANIMSSPPGQQAILNRYDKTIHGDILELDMDDKADTKIHQDTEQQKYGENDEGWQEQNRKKKRKIQVSRPAPIMGKQGNFKLNIDGSTLVKKYFY